MMPIRRLTAVMSSIALVAVLIQPANAQQQMSRWWVVGDGIGYSALGLFVGLAAGAATEDNDCGFGPCDTTVGAALAGGAAGLITGLVIGGSARQAVSQGRSIGSGQRAAVVVGTVLGAATLGAALSSLTINNEGSKNILGSDEAAFTILTLTGVLGGVFFTHRHMDELSPHQIKVAPVMTKRSAGLSARVVF